MVKLVQETEKKIQSTLRKAFEICAELQAKLVNVLQGNKTVTFGVIFPTEQ